MKAVVLKRAGSADGLRLTDLPEPTPVQGDVLVKVHATSVTRGDVVLRRMPRLITRLVGETPKTILGHEFAGMVEDVGDGVTAFEIGDRVFGTTTALSQGSYAEYIALPASGVVATIPPDVGYEQAAPVPIGAMAALHFLREGGVGAGKSVLIVGASGSVGSFAVQIANHFGARVIGVSSTSNMELVESLGAHEVIDYTSQDFTRVDRRYDVIFDTVGTTSAKGARRVLADTGAFVTTRTRRDETIEELLAVKKLLETGAVKPVIDRCYPLEQIGEAHRYVEQGHKRGNVVIVTGR